MILKIFSNITNSMILWFYAVTTSKKFRTRPFGWLCEERCWQSISDGLMVETWGAASTSHPPICTLHTCPEPGVLSHFK